MKRLPERIPNARNSTRLQDKSNQGLNIGTTDFHSITVANLTLFALSLEKGSTGRVAGITFTEKQPSAYEPQISVAKRAGLFADQGQPVLQLLYPC